MDHREALASIPLLVRAANLIDESFLITTAKLHSPGPQIVYVNQAFKAMTGYDSSDVIGLSPRLLQGPATSRLTLQRLRRCLEEGRDFDGRLVNYRKDGSRFLLDLRIRPIRDDEGRVSHYFAVQRDATREAEDVARRQRLEQALDQTLDSVIVFAGDGRTHYANPAYLAWSGASEEQVIGEKIWNLPGFPRNREDFQWARRRLARGHSWQREYEIDLRQGEYRERRVVFTTISPVRAHGEVVSDFVAISRDVTERSRLMNIAKAHSQADQLERMFAVFRHELGNPVNSIKSALTVLESAQDPLSERQSRYVSRILDEVSRMEFLLASLRNFGQFERVRIEPIGVADLFERVEAMLVRAAAGREIELEVVAPDPSVEVRGDEQGLVHALVHLGHNSLDALAGVEEARLRIECLVVPGRVSLRVRDNGCGIAEEDQGRILGPFFTTRPKRAGLGLTIVNKLVTKMNGVLSIESRPGIGTTVTLDLELATGGERGKGPA